VYSNFPYSPIQLDTRFGSDTKTPLTEKHGFRNYETGYANVCGRDSLGENHTSTAVLGQMALDALGRFVASYKESRQPFSLSGTFADTASNVSSYEHF